MPTNIEVSIPISDERINDLIISAIEGGINYWCRRIKLFDADNDRVGWAYVVKKGIVGNTKIVFIEDDGQDGAEHTLDLLSRKFYNFPDELQSGLRAMATKYPWHFAHFIGENDDAETADVFIQCCLFGGLRYG